MDWNTLKNQSFMNPQKINKTNGSTNTLASKGACLPQRASKKWAEIRAKLDTKTL